MKIKLAILFVFLITLLPIIPQKFANAQESCEALVSNQTEGIDVFGGSTQDVERAASELQDRVGAVVYVRAIDTFRPEGSLDQYFERVMLPSCPNWQQTNGLAKNNLIVLLASFREDSREIGVYFGFEFRPALDSTWRNEVAAEEVLPRFRDGEFASGYIDGLNRIQEVIVDYENPPANTGGGSSEGSGDTTNIDAGPIAKVVGIIFGVIVALVVAAVGVYFFMRWRESVAQRKASQQKAINARSKVNSNLNNSRDLLNYLDPLINSFALQVDEPTAQALKNDWDGADKRLADVHNALEGQSVTFDPTDDKLSREQFENIEAEYNRLFPISEEALKLAEQTQRNYQNLRDLIAQAPTRLASVQNDLMSVEQGISSKISMGFKVEKSQSLLIQAKEQLLEAQRLVEEKSFGLATGCLNKANDLGKEAQETANTIVRRKMALDHEIEKLTFRIQSTETAIFARQEDFAYISENYAPETYRSVSGNGTESEKRVAKALEDLDSAKIAASMENQEWEKAEKLVESANKALDQADSFLHSIIALREHLDKAKQDAPIEITAAEKDLLKATDYIAANKADVRGQYKDYFLKARELISEAKTQLNLRQPNYLIVVKKAKEANEIADSVLNEARSEVEAAERLRRAAATSLRDAKAAVSRLEEFLEDHRSDIGSDPENELNSALNLLMKAENTKNLTRLIDLAREAENLAERGYNEAENDFERAEQAREEEERRRRRSSYSSSYSSGGFGSWGSGGGFSIGRSGGSSFGGGSIGFGRGGGGHGGGSIKW